jgi:uncharacterized RDD family membrane protein YckC
MCKTGRMADDHKNKDDAELTPLQRYLAKQKSETSEATSHPERASTPTYVGRNESASSQTIDVSEELRAVPKAPPPPLPPSPPGGSHAQPSAALGRTPASFFLRFLAYGVDTLIVFAISLPIRGFMGFFLWFLPLSGSDSAVSPMSWSGFLAVQVITFFYYGWFYSEKGATPGKMLFGLQVRLVANEAHPSYAIAYLRESVGKYISSLILLIGYLVALFRDDHRALHDLAFGTQVVNQPKTV